MKEKQDFPLNELYNETQDMPSKHFVNDLRRFFTG
jgi:hypothetical protein